MFLRALSLSIGMICMKFFNISTNEIASLHHAIDTEHSIVLVTAAEPAGKVQRVGHEEELSNQQYDVRRKKQ